MGNAWLPNGMCLYCGVVATINWRGNGMIFHVSPARLAFSRLLRGMTELQFSHFGVMFLTEWPLVWSLLHFFRGVHHSVRRQTPSTEVTTLTFGQGKQCFGTFQGGDKFCLVSTFLSHKYGPLPFTGAPVGGTRPLQDLIILLSSSTSASLQQLGGTLDTLQATVINVRYAASTN